MEHISGTLVLVKACKVEYTGWQQFWLSGACGFYDHVILSQYHPWHPTFSVSDSALYVFDLGWTCLHVAASRGHDKVVEYLLEVVGTQIQAQGLFVSFVIHQVFKYDIDDHMHFGGARLTSDI